MPADVPDAPMLAAEPEEALVMGLAEAEPLP